MIDNNTHIEKEVFSYYATTQAFINGILYKDNDKKTSLLSVGGRLEHLVSMAPMFKSILHVTKIPIEKYENVINLSSLFGFKFVQVVDDFFSLEKEDMEKYQVEVCVSHATVHCMNDDRYGNPVDDEIRAYRFANHLRKTFPTVNRVILSVATSDRDKAVTQYSRALDNSKFIHSFEKEGFRLEKLLYDKDCLSINKYKKGECYTENFPEGFCSENGYIIGNYYFKSL